MLRVKELLQIAQVKSYISEANGSQVLLLTGACGRLSLFTELCAQ